MVIMKVKYIIYLLNIIILIFASSQPIAGGKYDWISRFYYAHIVDNIPYIIINDVELLYETQCALLHSLHDSTYSADYRLELDTATPRTLPAYVQYHDQPTISGFEIRGGDSGFSNFLKFKIGSKFIIHRVAPGESGPRASVTILMAILCASRHSSVIILVCEPLDEEIVAMLTPYHWPSTLVAYRIQRPFKIESSKAIDVSCPSHITSALSQLSEKFFPSNISTKSRRISSTPLKYVNDNGGIYNCFVVVLSYGEKGSTGILHLLDKKGNIIQSLEGKDYTRIIGVLDFSDNGSQALLVHFGGYTGGVELLGFPKRSIDPPNLTTLLRIGTYSD
jgi:hypothetical protein